MSGVAHFLHFCMTILTGGWWLPVWVICALCIGSSHKSREMDMKKEELKLLRQLVRKGK
jgi:hypothetical protein